MEESRADRARRRRRQHPSKQRISLALGQEKTREGASITSSSGNNSARHDKLRDGGTDGGSGAAPVAATAVAVAVASICVKSVRLARCRELGDARLDSSGGTKSQRGQPRTHRYRHREGCIHVSINAKH